MQTARLDSLAVRPQVQARIDTDAVRDNVAAVRARVAAAHPAGSAPGLLAVVKANAYGHGLVPCARAALLGGADLLGTAVFAESLALRAAGIEARLLSWLAAPGADYAPVLTARIEIGVSSTWQLTEVLDAAERTGTPATVHLKVDTGLGRNGAMPADWPELVAATAGAVAAGSVPTTPPTGRPTPSWPRSPTPGPWSTPPGCTRSSSTRPIRRPPSPDPTATSTSSGSVSPATACPRYRIRRVRPSWACDRRCGCPHIWPR
jgi:hypothetical protein